MACKRKKKMACDGKVKKRRKMESGGTVTPKPKKKDTTAKADSTLLAKRKSYSMVGFTGIPVPLELRKKNRKS